MSSRERLRKRWQTAATEIHCNRLRVLFIEFVLIIWSRIQNPLNCFGRQAPTIISPKSALLRICIFLQHYHHNYTCICEHGAIILSLKLIFKKKINMPYKIILQHNEWFKFIEWPADYEVRIITDGFSTPSNKFLLGHGDHHKKCNGTSVRWSDSHTR